jgi:hypothetical protein
LRSALTIETDQQLAEHFYLDIWKDPNQRLQGGVQFSLFSLLLLRFVG